MQYGKKAFKNIRRRITMFRNVFYVMVQTNAKFLCMIGSDGQSSFRLDYLWPSYCSKKYVTWIINHLVPQLHMSFISHSSMLSFHILYFHCQHLFRFNISLISSVQSAIHEAIMSLHGIWVSDIAEIANHTNWYSSFQFLFHSQIHNQVFTTTTATSGQCSYNHITNYITLFIMILWLNDCTSSYARC